MTDSQKQTAQSSVSSPRSRTKPKPNGRTHGTILGLVNVVVIILGFYLLQEGLAHISHPNFVFFAEFQAWLTYLAGAAIILTIPNLAIAFFSIRRNLPVPRWAIATTVLAIILTGVVVEVIGPSEVLTIINPNW